MMFSMTLNRDDAQLVERFTSQMTNSEFAWVNSKLKCEVAYTDLPVLRKILEEADNDNADGLIASIMVVVDIDAFAHWHGFSPIAPQPHQTGAWAQTVTVEVMPGLTRTGVVKIVTDSQGFTMTANFEKEEVKASYTVTFEHLHQFKELFDYYFNLIQRITKLII